jgi:TonB family protein
MEHDERRRSLVIGGAIVLSFALHGIAFAAVGGHAKQGAAADTTVTLEIEAAMIDAPVLEDVKKEEPKPDDDHDHDHENEHHAATHTHDYPVPASHDETPHDPNLVHTPLALPAAPHAVDSAPAPAAAPEVAAAAEPAAPHFTMALGAPGAKPSSGLVATNGVGASNGGTGSGGDADDHDGHDVAHAAPESGVDTPAKILFAPEPRYPDAAESAGIEAQVPVEIIVDATGAVRSARALSHAGYGLDEAAVAGVRSYRFTPAVRSGHTVAVRMKWSVEFKLR